jgi:putative two-component system response regulator
MRDTILIVDDEELNRELLCQMFEGKYKLLTAADGREGIMLLGKHINEIAVILLDIVMPVVNGYQVLQVLHSRDIISRIPVVLITAQDDDQTELQCYQMGASALISKPFKAQTVIKRVDDIINMHQNVEVLQQQVKTQEDQLLEQQKKLEDFNERLLDVISNVVEFRDVESGEHIKRVKGLTRIMAKTYQAMYPEEHITDATIDIITKASAMHDIGKISIPDHILLKPGRLTDDEKQVMMSHTTKGCEILNMLASFQDEEQFKAAYDICRYHHERYDGSGYPDKLKGDQIPLSAQLVSVADVYDALVSDRVYKKAYDKDTAYEMIVTGKCGQFSPKMMACFEKARKAIESLAEMQSNSMMEV